MPQSWFKTKWKNSQRSPDLCGRPTTWKKKTEKIEPGRNRDIEESRRKHQKNYASRSREDRVSIKQEQSTIEKKEWMKNNVRNLKYDRQNFKVL